MSAESMCEDTYIHHRITGHERLSELIYLHLKSLIKRTQNNFDYRVNKKTFFRNQVGKHSSIATDRQV